MDRSPPEPAQSSAAAQPLLSRHAWQLLLLGLAGFLLAWTFTHPTASLPAPQYRYVYVFDISQSMNVTDMGTAAAPLSRLEAAKAAAIHSAGGLPCGSEIGLALFTGHRPFLLMTPVEVCANYGELTDAIRLVDWRMTWRQRSEIAKGLFKSVELMTRLEVPPQLVFFTDGHEAPPIDPELPPRFDGRPGEVDGLLVGVGGAAPAPIPRFDELGNALGHFTAADLADMPRAGQALPDEHLSQLREAYLQDIAATVGLEYHRLAAPAAFTAALQQARLGRTAASAVDLRPTYALIALLLVLLATTGSGRTFRPGGRAAQR